MRKPIVIVLAVVAVNALLASVFAVATRTEAKSPVDDLPMPAVAAHRGFNDINPENTMTAFRDAVENHDAKAIEMDVMELKDGALVLSHDTDISKTSGIGGTGLVKNMTSAQWRQHRVKTPSGGAPVPAAFLSDVLDEYGGTDIVLVPELKNDTSREKFVEAFQPYKEQVIVQSFDAANASVLARSGFRTLQLTSDPNVALVGDVWAVGFSDKVITEAVVARVHSAGAKVWAWGVNLKPDDAALIEKGVDGIIATTPSD